MAEPTRYLRVCDEEVTLSTYPDDKFEVRFLEPCVEAPRERRSSTRQAHTWHGRMQCKEYSYSMVSQKRKHKKPVCTSPSPSRSVIAALIA